VSEWSGLLLGGVQSQWILSVGQEVVWCEVDLLFVFTFFDLVVMLLSFYFFLLSLFPFYILHYF